MKKPLRSGGFLVLEIAVLELKQGEAKLRGLQKRKALHASAGSTRGTHRAGGKTRETRIDRRKEEEGAQFPFGSRRAKGFCENRDLEKEKGAGCGN